MGICLTFDASLTTTNRSVSCQMNIRTQTALLPATQLSPVHNPHCDDSAQLLLTTVYQYCCGPFAVASDSCVIC